MGRMKRPKKKTAETDLISRNEFIYLLQNIQSYNPLRDRAMICMLYVTGCRVSELVQQVKKYDLDIQEIRGTKFLIINNVWCLKRKAPIKRNIPICIEKEQEFMKYIYDYVVDLDPGDILFPISRQHAYNIVRKFKDEAFPHYFRHLRLTNLAKDYGFNSAELRQYTGWTDDKPASHYVHLNWKDTAKKMLLR